MEYTQWAHHQCEDERESIRLNPCCNGIYSMRAALHYIRTVY